MKTNWGLCTINNRLQVELVPVKFTLTPLNHTQLSGSIDNSVWNYITRPLVICCLNLIGGHHEV